MEVAVVWKRRTESLSPTSFDWKQQGGGLQPNTTPSKFNTRSWSKLLGVHSGWVREDPENEDHVTKPAQGFI